MSWRGRIAVVELERTTEEEHRGSSSLRKVVGSGVYVGGGKEVSWMTESRLSRASVSLCSMEEAATCEWKK